VKQHVTVEQVIGNTYVYDQLGTMYCEENNTCTYTAEDIAKWVNIGKMIELIMNETCNEYPTFLYDVRQHVRVKLYQHPYTITEFCEEICDALWQTVKEVLQR
jgi:hypothetical protein